MRPPHPGGEGRGGGGGPPPPPCSAIPSSRQEVRLAVVVIRCVSTQFIPGADVMLYGVSLRYKESANVSTA